MIRRRKFLAAVAALGVLLPVLSAEPAAADHLPDQGAVWALSSWGSDYSLETYFTTTFPAGAKRDRVVSGANAWNMYASSDSLDPEPRLVFQSTDRTPYDYKTTCGGSGNVTVFWDDLDYIGTSILGVERTCIYQAAPNRMSSSSVAFDSTRSNWYDGVGDAPDPILGLVGGSYDFWSVASHEFGHTMAFLHFAESDPICGDGSGQATMCPKTKIGTERQRSLEWHDYISFQNLYPQYFA